MKAEIGYEGNRLAIYITEMSPTEAGLIQRELTATRYRAASWDGRKLVLLQLNEEAPCPTKTT